MAKPGLQEIDSAAKTSAGGTEANRLAVTNGSGRVGDSEKVGGQTLTNLDARYAMNAFKTVKVGATDVIADSPTDILELVAGTGITLTPDAVLDKITIAASVQALPYKWTLISETTLAVDTAQVDYASIPSTYDYLLVIADSLRNNDGGTTTATLRINDDSSTSYLTNVGTNTTESGLGIQFTLGGALGDSDGTNSFGMFSLLITNITGQKPMGIYKAESVNFNGTNYNSRRQDSGLTYMSSGKFTKMSFTANGASFKAGSRFKFYGGVL